jgi:ferredoxin
MSKAVGIQVDRDKCVGSRICTAIAPKVFALDQNGQASVVDPAGDTSESIQAAAEGCPVSAITVEDVK